MASAATRHGAASANSGGGRGTAMPAMPICLPSFFYQKNASNFLEIHGCFDAGAVQKIVQHPRPAETLCLARWEIGGSTFGSCRKNLLTYWNDQWIRIKIHDQPPFKKTPTEILQHISLKVADELTQTTFNFFFPQSKRFGPSYVFSSNVS